MLCRIEKSRIRGWVNRPPSNKSYTHRAIFIASLARSSGESRIENILLSDDTMATIDACGSFGADIGVEDKSLAIVRSPINLDTNVPKIDTKNSGTTIRIAAGIAGLFSDEITLTGDSSLQKRPMQPLLDALSSLGAVCSSVDGKPPIKIRGKITGGDVTIPGDLSSQFISALLIVAPLTDRGIGICITGNLVSKPYLDATISTMRKFGVSVQTVIPYKMYRVAPQAYKATTFEVPADFSSLALLLSAAALNGSIAIKGAISDLPQGDEMFIDILVQLGVDITVGDDEIHVRSSIEQRLHGGRFDLSNSPDLLPPLAILALRSSEPIEIVNVGHARFKETDRIAILSRELTKLGVGVEERSDGLLLIPPDSHASSTPSPSPSPSPAPSPAPPSTDEEIVLDSENDHRLFMAFCIAATYVGGCTVTNPESVAVSYPGFVDVLKGLGAKITLV